ncbi:MAG: alpha/beta hydrolase-fold protein [Bacteroidota bacterium]
MVKLNFLTLLLCLIIISCWSCATSKKVNSSSQNVTFQVAFPAKLASDSLDGRLLLLLSTNDEKEPRFQISDGPNTQLAFGLDVENVTANQSVTFNASAFGYPLKSISDIPKGEYYVQALLNVYETYHRADGHIVQLPADNGEGQQWNRSPGNLYSTPKKVRIGTEDKSTFTIKLDQKIAPIEPPADTKYIKHVKIKSERLSKFWGQDIYLGAHVLLPKGFEENLEVKYPLAIMHGHFPYDFGGFRETPPAPDLKPTYSARFDLEGYNIIEQQEAYDFYKLWTSDNFPRVIAIKIQHANQYYDDSYAVNSENLGPYGDAITYELIPYIEAQFRGIGQGWARFVYGGSTGGWEALAVQVKYPDEYNGCYAACPDPIDFRAYGIIDLYQDKNAYFLESTFKQTPRPMRRDYLGKVSTTMQEANYRELVLGTKSRSGQQWDIWEAVFSPVGDDGYPKRIWNKLTGDINPKVAEYWKENYDLTYIMKRDWVTIGPKLKGKIHIYCGDMDNYYLNNAVYLAEDFLESTSEPYYDGEVDYGEKAEHCWNGDHTQPNAISRLRYHSMFISKWAREIEQRAPEGVDLESWRY